MLLPLDNRENKNLQNVCLSQIRENIFVKISTYTVSLCSVSGFSQYQSRLWYTTLFSKNLYENQA